jgi:hypothetical protein
MSLALLSFGLLSACVPRPYYRQVLPPDVAQLKPTQAEGREGVTLRLVDPETGRPIAGGRVLVSGSRGRVNVTSDADGLVRLPVTPGLLAENPLVEVVPPKGVKRYVLQPVVPEPEAAPQPPQG